MSKRNLTSKQIRVLNYIHNNGGVTPKEAETNLSDHRLAGTVFNLRRKGFDIDTLRMDTTNKYGEPTWYAKYVFAQGTNYTEEDWNED